ncbi:hypothetical protein BDK51DRAFT_48722 [Blyttiomyces helicus]|uniref:Uncharacterized protein n=1 Tax=Blyttiomyces helicus TaxID=388810 RepID=A0A4P9VYA7_9FUNG|nr:hypothetical protein BDK51DRAFT_48722 [Blyttiomyces helicus]|eukprot:RKO84761.1 hypothetical protein BDK51DRAFT_48722 [Blyttiomyces helicus]
MSLNKFLFHLFPLACSSFAVPQGSLGSLYQPEVFGQPAIRDLAPVAPSTSAGSEWDLQRQDLEGPAILTSS